MALFNNSLGKPFIIVDTNALGGFVLHVSLEGQWGILSEEDFVQGVLSVSRLSHSQPGISEWAGVLKVRTWTY